MKTIRKIVLALIATAVLVVASGQTAGFKVIVNSSNPMTSISRKSLSEVFMKRTPKWANGVAVTPVDQADASPVRGEFSHDVHGKPTGAVKSYWNQQIFSGRDVPPVEKVSDAEVVAFVRANPGAIGYVSSGSDTDGVRVVPVE